jgi:hypothetical protein
LVAIIPLLSLLNSPITKFLYLKEFSVFLATSLSLLFFNKF